MKTNVKTLAIGFFLVPLLMVGCTCNRNKPPEAEQLPNPPPAELTTPPPIEEMPPGPGDEDYEVPPDMEDYGDESTD